MKKYFLKLMLYLSVLFSFTLFAGEKVDKTIEVGRDGNVEIHNVRGEITVIGWANNQVNVVGTLDDLAEEFVLTSNNGTTYIKVKLPRNSSHYNREGSQLTIKVPHGVKVSFVGVATDLNISQIQGGVDVNSVSGKIRIDNSQGKTSINSVSGNLYLNNLTGSLYVSTVSGDLEAKVACNNVHITGISSNLNVALVSFESAYLSSVSGKSLFSGEMVEQGKLELTSVSGELTFQPTAELDAQISIDTAPGGEIINEYSAERPVKSFISSQSLKFISGSGAGKIKVSTVSGVVKLKAIKQAS